MEKNLPKRKHPRLKSFDYSMPGAYFITICTQNKRCLLSNIVKEVHLSADLKSDHHQTAENQYTIYGEIAKEQLFLLEKRYPSVKIDRYVIMPNHIHVIIALKSAG